MLSGWILLNKPVGLSSRFAGNIIRKKISAQKFGHIGTLDPKASGLLPIIFDNATRFAFGLEKCNKTYQANIQLGGQSTTDDIEGEIIKCAPVALNDFCLDNINNLLKNFVGEIKQIPPNYSAVRIEGKRLYKTNRKNAKQKKEIDINNLQAPERKVTVNSIEVVSVDSAKQQIVIDINCGSGTYIRSIARDFGKLINSGGYLVSLERVSLNARLENEENEFSIKDSVSMSEIESLSSEEIITRHLKPADKLIKQYPSLCINKTNADKLYFGQLVEINQKILDNTINHSANNIYRLYLENNLNEIENSEFIGVGEIVTQDDSAVLIAKRLLPQTSK